MIKNKFLTKELIKITITLIVIIFCFLVSSFLSKQINKISSGLEEKKEMDYLIVNRDKVNSNIKTDFMNVDPNYSQKIENALPSVYNVLSFVDAMESLSKKYSFKQELSFNQPSEINQLTGPLELTTVNFNLTISETNIDNFIAYLEDFEKLPYFASIQSISYLGGKDNGWKDNSSINIIGSFYARK